MAPQKPRIPDYTIEDALIKWRNFAGRERQYNAEGDRNFTIFLNSHDSARLTEMGLNVKTLPMREEDTEPQDILKVKVNFKGIPPRLVMVTHRGRTTLDAETAGLLDLAQIKKVDLILSPYHWELREKEGVAVSLKAIYMTIVEDELEMKYSDLPEAASTLSSLEYTPDEPTDENYNGSGPRFE